jgi:hypothetical protein
MLSAQHGAFVVEVKGGQHIEVLEGKWYSTPHGSNVANEIANPFTQAADSKSVLWDYLRENVPSLRLKGELGHMVVFPGHRQHGDMTPQARREIICDREDLGDLPATMARVSQYFSQKTRWSEEQVQAAKERLMPSFRLLGAERGDLDEFLDELDRLTEMQLVAFSMLRKQNKLIIHGGAGSGKTVLAFHRAKELALQGHRVIYLCSSDPLRRYLIEVLSRMVGTSKIDSLEIHSVASLTSELWSQHSKPIVNFPEDFVSACASVSDEGKEMFDAVILDEAQNMHEDVAFGTLLLLRDDGYQFIFGDPNQSTADIHQYLSDMPIVKVPRMNALNLFGTERAILLNVNCRSSAQIAEFADQIVGVSSETVGKPFQDVTLTISPMSESAHAVARAIRGYKADFGLGPKDIAILVPPELTVLLGLFNEYGNIDEDGLTRTEDLIIDWLGERPSSNEYSRFVEESQQIREYLSSGPELSEDVEQRWVWYKAWRNEKATEHRSIPDNRGARHVARQHRMESMNLERFWSTPIDNFVGLEAQAVIAVLPHLGQHATAVYKLGHENLDGRFESFSAHAYTMITRARALVTVIGDESSMELLGAIRRSRSV